MSEGDPRPPLEQALAFLRAGETRLALGILEKLARDSEEPAVLSAYGFCSAQERGQVRAGVELCQRAIRLDASNAMHYLLLARVHLKGNDKTAAIASLRQGVRSDGDSDWHAELLALLDRLGMRRPPPLRFLSRDHVLNKYLGLVLGRLGLR